MQHQDALHTLAAQFAHWRQNKATLGKTTPHALRQQALSLSEHHSVSKIITTLGVSGSMFKKWQTHTVDARSSSLESKFVSFPDDALSTPCNAPALRLTFDNGGAIDMNAKVPLDVVTGMIQMLWQGETQGTTP